MGQVFNFRQDDGISIPPRPRRIDPPGGGDDGPPVLGFILIYVCAVLVGYILGSLFA